MSEKDKKKLSNTNGNIHAIIGESSKHVSSSKHSNTTVTDRYSIRPGVFVEEISVGGSNVAGFSDVEDEDVNDDDTLSLPVQSIVLNDDHVTVNAASQSHHLSSDTRDEVSKSSERKNKRSQYEDNDVVEYGTSSLNGDQNYGSYSAQSTAVLSSTASPRYDPQRYQNSGQGYPIAVTSKPSSSIDRTSDTKPTTTNDTKRSSRDNISSSSDRIETITHDGTKITKYKNGTIKKTFTDGSSEVTFVNGDIKYVQPYTDGGLKVVYFYAQANTKHTTYPDGTEVYEFPNKQVTLL
jgi:hypothetical protein